MSKQINFYITEEEELLIIKKIKDFGLKLLLKKSSNTKPEEFESPIKVDSDRPSQLFLSDNNKNLEMQPVYDDLQDKEVYVITTSVSSVIEYSSPNINHDDKRIINGRFYLVTYRFNNKGKKVRINQGLDEYYKILSKEIKKICRKSDSYFYISNTAYDEITGLIDSGYKVSG